MIRRSVCMLLLVLTFWGFGQMCGRAEETAPPSYTREEVLQFMRSSAAPGFTLASTAGQSVSLADYAGNLVLVSFWVSWDDACLENMALLSGIQQAHEDVTVLLINDLTEESQNASWSEQARAEHIHWVNGYLSEKGYDLSVLIDEAGTVSESHRHQGVTMPVTCFIDREGVLRIPWQGQLSKQTLETLLSMMRALDS